MMQTEQEQKKKKWLKYQQILSKIIKSLSFLKHQNTKNKTTTTTTNQPHMKIASPQKHKT
jgi:hypothetical protein